VPTEVRLPQAGMGMTDGTVLDWLKDVGDEVRQGECIAEVEAAKTTVEIEAPCDGVLTRILTPVGTLVPVREVMAVIAAPGEPGQPAARPAGAPQVVPAARRLAREHGIDLAEVTGSGPGGRITEADVRACLLGRDTRVIPLTGVRGVIAKRMLASLQSSAPFTLTRLADVTTLAGRRDRGELPASVSYTDVLARAAVLSLAEHPALNGHVIGDEIRLAASVHLGIGIDAGDALLVGVLHEVGGLGLAELSARRRALVARVLAGQAAVGEMQGSTFTITNLGSAGIDAFTPIINPPEVAILGIGRIADQPVPSRDGGVAWRKSLTLSLTVDHRAVDGAPAARFLATLASYLGDPTALL
jgi:pyruvate dehydrogenase E2 component (dihydrolipoamide acetyltransferase)